MRILITDTSLTGHHLEYIHHLWCAAATRPDVNFVFALPEDFVEKRKIGQWNDYPNISVRLIPTKEIAKIKGGMMKRCWVGSLLMRRLIKEEKTDEIWLIFLAAYLPLLPLIMPRHCKLSGIIYRIWLWSNDSRLRMIINRFTYRVLSKSKRVRNIFILNDKSSTQAYNQMFCTNHFKYLPDPFTDLECTDAKDIRQELDIPSDNRLFIHFGSLDVRKGTLDILNAITMLPQGMAATYVFAGRVAENIHSEFYGLVDRCRKLGHHIVIKDMFCSFSFIHNLCHSADCILVPYHNVDSSSGVIGYAALHHKPVIAPAGGLLGKLVTDNALGICLPKTDAASLANAIVNFTPYSTYSDYLADKTPNDFQRSFLDLIDG